MIYVRHKRKQPLWPAAPKMAPTIIVSERQKAALALCYQQDMFLVLRGVEVPDEIGAMFEESLWVAEVPTLACIHDLFPDAATLSYGVRFNLRAVPVTLERY
jgi:hypothetical protein